MLLNTRTTRLLVEAAEMAGMPRARFFAHLRKVAGIGERELVDPKMQVEWSTVVRACDELAKLFDGDVERLRDVGRVMAKAPSYEPFRQLARGILSVRTLYQITNRWVAPANFPHLRLLADFIGRNRLQYHGEIPPVHAACEAFFYVFEGSVEALPTVLGWPASTIVESRITPRTCDFVVEVPSNVSAGSTMLDRVRSRVRRGVGAVLSTRAALSILEEQRRELVDDVEALHRARNELRTLLDRLPDLVVVQRGGTIVWANRAFVTALAYDRSEDVVGRQLLDLVAERDRREVAERMRAPPPVSEVTAILRVAMRMRTGEEIIVEASPAQVVVFDGVPARLIVGRDVTERVRMQQKLIVAERLTSIGLLAAGVAHEVNNPLAYVLNNIEIARKELAALGPQADVSRRVLGVALEGVDRIRTIVRDLLMLSRGDGESMIVPIDVCVVVESTLALAASEIDRTARLVKDVSPVPLVYATDARIAQILLNLVNNALEAMRGRPRERNVLTVRIARASESAVCIEVSDTGRGIEAAHMRRLFEPFFTTKAAGEGTGLGLPIVQHLVADLGGEIRITSKPENGTTVSISLPSAQARDVAMDASARAPAT